ncbi:MAG: sigma-70 family RNA polymerase sigma factor [Acidobacteria bacterium]|nr:sigma-70 family RNA polymerase sigma factor [Acidobacteriota bacterium]
MDSNPGQVVPDQVTVLLERLAAGDPAASPRLIPLVYRELRQIAQRCMRRERPDHTLQATALVHEALMKLGGQRVPFKNRAHFFGVAASLMRRFLLDYAREHRAMKRGGDAVKLELEDGMVVSEAHLEEILDLDRCLNRLAQVDPEQSRLVELRFFAGMTVEEVAEVMGISTATVKREWSHAKAWLHREMRQSGQTQGSVKIRVAYAG